MMHPVRLEKFVKLGAKTIYSTFSISRFSSSVILVTS